MTSDVDLITAEMVIRARQIRLHAEDRSDFDFVQSKPFDFEPEWWSA